MAVQWGHLKPTPDSILEFVSRSWKRSGCAAVNLPCTDLCGCANRQERVDVNEIFSDDDDFIEYQGEDTDGEADDSSDSSEDELFDHYEIDMIDKLCLQKKLSV